MMNKRLFNILVSTGCAFSIIAQPVDSIPVVGNLGEVTVTATGSRKLITSSHDGSLRISSSLLGEQAGFMGGNDPVALLRTLPSVATTNELQASLNVRGAYTGDNLFMSDGGRVVNPLHMFGLYSAFNSSFYRNYIFMSGRIPATNPSVTSAMFIADSGMEPDSATNGSVSVGLIESHGAIRVPFVKGKSSIALGMRRSYIDVVLPGVLKLGDSYMSYRFTDLNASLISRLSSRDLLRISFFGNSDRLAAEMEKNGRKEGKFDWSNIAASAEWQHRLLNVSVAFSRYRNGFFMNEGGRELNLPSTISQYTARADYHPGDLSIGADVNFRETSGQNCHGKKASTECNVGAEWEKRLASRFEINLGIRLSIYDCEGYFTFIPQPRITLGYEIDRNFRLFGAYGRYARFDRLIEETTAGLPADFWTCATADIPPEDVHSIEAGITGIIPHTGICFSIEGYFRKIIGVREYSGSLLDLANPDYNPLENLLKGSGAAYGLSVSALRQFGAIRGRIGYNIGKSEVKFPELGTSRYPSAHDRLHDLCVSMSWSIIPPLVLSANFTHATGIPYTQAKYGYMVGENLVCEYFPHNSSRLPAYNRLDLSLSYSFKSGKRLSHTVNLSVYNALANRNVLFRYTSYSVESGIRHRQSVMKAVIPSVSYTINF